MNNWHKAATLVQPFASLCLMVKDGVALKSIETRPWNTEYRGTVLIHAGLSKYYGKKPNEVHCAQLCLTSPFNRYFNLHRYYDLPFVAIIGKVDLCAVVTTDRIVEHGALRITTGKYSGMSWKLTDEEKAFGDYSPGRYAFLLGNPVALARPIPMKGALNLWDVSDKMMGFGE